MKRVLITGGAGFIGSNLALELEKKGREVIIVDNLFSGDKNNLRHFKGEFIEADISKPFDTNEEIEIIFHLASNTDTTFKDDKEMIRNNIESFVNVIKLAKKNNAKLIYASSAAVYGDGKSPMKENQELKPLNAYALSKYLIDRIAELFYGQLPLIVGLRYFNVFGPNEAHKKKTSSMIHQLAQQTLSGKNPRIFKYGEQKRDHIYVKDIAQATIKASELKTNCILNVGTGTATSFNDLIKYINIGLGTNYRPEYFDNPYTAFYQETTCADMALSHSKGIKAEYSTKGGIIEYVKMLKEVKNES